MVYTISNITDIIDGEALQLPYPDHWIRHLLFDSRQINVPAEALFFAIKGKRHDGHLFINDLYKEGVRSFVVTKRIDGSDFPGANFVLVADAVEALQQLAVYHRGQFDIPVIGITGSNGKTIVKEWLFQLFAPDLGIVRSPRSYNSQLGVPLSVWQLAANHDLAIFEAGISTTGEMKKLQPIIRCSTGIFTNIGEAHAEGFASVEEKIAEKLFLFKDTQTLIYCKDYEGIHKAVQHSFSGDCFCWSKTDQQADLFITAIAQPDSNHTTIRGTYQKQLQDITIPFTDRASIENAIHCWSFLLLRGVDPEVIQERMLLLAPVEMRLELKAGINHCLLINDTYNSDLNSLTIALDFLAHQSPKLQRGLILSDILESGQTETDLYKQVGKQIEQKNITLFIGIGKAVTALKAWLPRAIDAYFFESSEAFIDRFDVDMLWNVALLVKGARKFRFENIIRHLSLKAHNAVLEINIDAFIHNLHVYNSYLSRGTKMMVMVKASAYGGGSTELGKVLQFHQVDFLGVAYADEGADLRRGGIHLPILVLNPDEASFPTIYKYHLQPEIYNFRLLDTFLNFLPEGRMPYPVQLKLDTGMHRLGFAPKELPELCRRLKNQSKIKVTAIFSHLAASEADDHDAFSKQQVQSFLKMYEQLEEALGYAPIKHILNSAGILRFPQYQMDMVRLGIGIYGIDSSETIQRQLKNVLSLKGRISQIKHISPPDTVGYNRKGKVEATSRIATVSVGYADGLPRLAGNGRFSVMIQGKNAPIIGDVCMDMFMVNISSIPEAREGDEVTIFANSQQIWELANCSQTIPYEIFTGISERVKRVYFKE